ncbi:MAG: subclass B3 metallo-beta-lactamase [Oligoflexales bacterium]
MKAKFVTLLLLTVFTAATIKAEPKNWREPAAPFHIAGPIYYVGTKGLGVFLLKTNAGLILLNGAMPGSTPTLVESIRKLGFDSKDIRLLLTSHAHIDHVGTLADFKRLTGATVAAMDADVALLRSGGKDDYLFAAQPNMHFEGVTADKVLQDGETVTLGDVKMTAHLTPGHTRGCTTWETTINEGGKKYKVVFADGTGINEGTQFTKTESYRGITSDYKHTFAVLASLRPDIFLSYHAEFFDLDRKLARMKAEGFRAWIDLEGFKHQISVKKAAFEKSAANGSAI